MSKGNPQVVIRLPNCRLEQIKATVRRVNRTRHEEPYTVASWIRAAIDAKLQHEERARAQRGRRGRQSATAEALDAAAQVVEEGGAL